MPLNENRRDAVSPAQSSEYRSLELLVRSIRRLNESLELERLLGAVDEIVRAALACDHVSLVRRDDESGGLAAVLLDGEVSPDDGSPVDPERSLAGEALRRRLPLRRTLEAAQARDDSLLEPLAGAPRLQVLAVPLRRGDRTTGVLTAVRTGAELSFTLEDERFAVSLADNIALALENAYLYRWVQREKLESESLYRISAKLNQTLELREILPLLLDLLQQVIPYDAAAIYLIDESGSDVELFMSRGYDPEAERRVHLKLGQGAVGWVAKTGTPILMDDVRDDARYFNARPATRSELVVPMLTEGRVIGAFNLEANRTRAFHADDVKLLTTFAAQAAISIERARLHEELVEKRRLEQEVRIARTIQEGHAPRVPPELPGMEVAGLNVPSLEISGDLYDFIPVYPGHLGILVGDVVGKGIPAALVGSTFRAFMWAEIRNNYSIAKILNKVNALLIESQEQGSFVTSLYGVLDAASHRLTFSNAGHNPALWLRFDGAVEWLWEGGTVLGAFPDVSYGESAISLNPGDLVVFYTDGITEATDSRGEEFGPDRLVAVLRRERERAPREICRAIISAVRLHETGIQADDLTVVVLKVAPAAGMA
ncbi:MAG: SpoIIE family protein phosphatase [Candidatus Eisenbacteria bacterium]|nr:SpoIIE family protein phosphatase [Candidatus Eisenbacteria bacterium]